MTGEGWKVSTKTGQAYIVERVLHVATERFPVLPSLSIDASGLSCPQPPSDASLPYEQVSEALRFVLVEFLTVLGELTAEILTPALHAELSKRRAGRGSDAEGEEPTS